MVSLPRTVLASIAALVLLSTGAGCAHPAGGGTPGHQSTAPAHQTVRFDIVGMHCDGCAKGLQSELASAPGVRSARVSLRKRTAVVTCDPAQIRPESLVKVIETAGFKGSLKP